MKTVGVREAKERLSGWIREAQRETVLVVSHGRPAAVLIGVEGLDVEQAILAELHRRRMSRGSTSISGEELSKRLGIDPSAEAAVRRRALDGVQTADVETGAGRTVRAKSARSSRGPSAKKRGTRGKTRRS